MANDKHTLAFLSGGGELGEITRNYNWAALPVGTPDQWPQSLRTTLGLLLHSAFPMLLFWGEDLTVFYNDAFRPSLGVDGKHPSVGKPGKEMWPEIWDFIGPLINKVISTGEPVYFENQLVPFYRNGKMEEIYWTFSYSPAYNDDGRINGVFVTCTETTGAVKNLQQMAESESRFRTMAEATDIMIAIGDETSNATYFNQAWVDLTGRPMEDLLSYGWADLIHPDDREEYVNIYLAAFEKKEPFSGEFRILNREGNYRWLLAKGPPRFREDGSFAGYISSCVDITDRKNAEKSFSASEQRLRALVESAPFPIGVYIGREMRVALANQAIINIWGKGNDVIGKLFSEILPEEDIKEVSVQLDGVFMTGVPFHIRNQRLDLVVDGVLRPYYFNYSLTPLFDESGNIYGVMNTGADITDLNFAKQKIEQSEKNFRNMILQAPVAMCILMGDEHVIEIANDLMIELWGKPGESVMHKPVFEALPDAKEQGLEQLMLSVYRDGETFTASEMPVTLLRNGRSEAVYQNFVYEPYRDGDGTILGILAITIDVTAQVLARRRIEEIVSERTNELAAANAGLQRSNAELARFAYIASHDLQEPIRKIRTFSEMLEQSLGNINDRSRNYLGKINHSAERMVTLIKDVLTYSQLSSEKVAFEKVDLRQVVEGIKIDFELLIEQKNAQISCYELPVIDAIPLQMLQLFSNLVSNALKFSRPEKAPVISISAKRVDKKEAGIWYVIECSDNGIGFQQEYAESIFNIFQRLHGKKEYEGTGIGLALCKKIVDNHHGEIYATSSGNGSIFHLLLPEMQK